MISTGQPVKNNLNTPPTISQKFLSSKTTKIAVIIIDLLAVFLVTFDLYNWYEVWKKSLYFSHISFTFFITRQVGADFWSFVAILRFVGTFLTILVFSKKVKKIFLLTLVVSILVFIIKYINRGDYCGDPCDLASTINRGITESFYFLLLSLAPGLVVSSAIIYMYDRFYKKVI